MKKNKLVGLAALLLSLGMVGCNLGGGSDSEWECDKTNHWKVDGSGNIDSSTKGKHQYEAAPDKTVAATCSQEGSKVEICKVCGNEKTTTTGFADHTYVEDTTKAKAATCYAEGEKVENCSVCKDVKTTKLTKLAHDEKIEATGKEGVTKISCNRDNCNYVAYELDISKATGWNKATTKWNAKTTDADPSKVEASWDVTGVIADGNYSIELEGLMSYASHSDRYFYNQYETDTASQPDKAEEAPFRYFFKVNDGAAINPDTKKTWGDLGYKGSDEDGAAPAFANVVSTVAISGATKFSAFHGDIGFSLIVSKVRLVKIA